MMKDLDFDKIPRFSELPIKPEYPPGSSWGVFGDDDEIGCLNFLTPKGVAEAAALIQTGKTFRLDLPINLGPDAGWATPPLWRHEYAKLKIVTGSDFAKEVGYEQITKAIGLNDRLEFWDVEDGTQWDVLTHWNDPVTGLFYNGFTEEQVRGPEAKMGIQTWADRIAGRGALVDIYKYRADVGRPLDPLTDEYIPFEDLTGAMDAQGLTLKPGTILHFRTGFVQDYMKLPPEEKERISWWNELKTAGLQPSDQLMEFLWDNRVAALVTDCPAVEPWPWDLLGEDSLHFRTLPRLGLPIGEQYALDDLAADCAEDGRWEFFTMSTPLILKGSAGSPPNSLAIK
jgi:kynurenine formamidase